MPDSAAASAKTGGASVSPQHGRGAAVHVAFPDHASHGFTNKSNLKGEGVLSCLNHALYSMKICPLCHLKFDDSAEFCPKCKAELYDYEEVKKADEGGIPKSFWISVIWVCGFIGVMFLFYLFLYGKLDIQLPS